MNEESIEKQIRALNVGAFKDVIFDFLFPLIGLSVTALLFFFYMKPTYMKMQDMELELETQTAVLNVLNTKVAVLTKLSGSTSVLQENSDLVEKLYVSESNVPQLLDQLHQISTNAGLMVDRMNYSYAGAATDARGSSADATANVRKDDSSGTVNVALTIVGTYDQLGVFMQEIEKAARFAYVTTFRFSDSAGEGMEEMISANISVDSPYMYVQSAAVTDDPITLDITNPAFVAFINSIKDYTYYDFLNQEVVAEEVEAEVESEEPAAEPETTPAIEPVVEETTTESDVSEEEPETTFGF